MSVYIIDEHNHAHIAPTRRRNAEEAFCDLAAKIQCPIEVVEYGLDDNAVERLSALCTGVTIYK